MDWCNLNAACASLREEWTKAIQAVAEGLQKQEEEMMDSSPDPMDMEVYLTKIRHKVVRTIYTSLFPALSVQWCTISSYSTGLIPPHAECVLVPQVDRNCFLYYLTLP